MTVLRKEGFAALKAAVQAFAFLATTITPTTILSGPTSSETLLAASQAAWRISTVLLACCLGKLLWLLLLQVGLLLAWPLQATSAVLLLSVLVGSWAGQHVLAAQALQRR